MHRRPRPFRNLLPNLFQRLRPSETNGKSSRSSDVSGDGTSYTDSISMFSVPTSYTGGYYDRVDDESESLLTVSDLDNYRPRHPQRESGPYYAEYANVGGVGEKTPTNSPTPKASPKTTKALWEVKKTGEVKGEVIGERQLTNRSSPPKVARLESMRDTHRRMKALTQMFPSFVLDAQVENAEEVMKFIRLIFFLQPDEDAKLGFANIPDQMHRKAVKKGFNFTLMIAGMWNLSTFFLTS